MRTPLKSPRIIATPGELPIVARPWKRAIHALGSVATGKLSPTAVLSEPRPTLEELGVAADVQWDRSPAAMPNSLSRLATCLPSDAFREGCLHGINLAAAGFAVVSVALGNQEHGLARVNVVVFLHHFETG